MEAVQGRVQEAVTKMITQIDKEHLRKIQADMYHCSAKCCENPHNNMEGVQRCIEQCSVPINHCQQGIQQELSDFQGRLQRCAMDCQSETKDKFSSETSDADKAKYMGQMENCVVKCADKHIALVPQMMKRMKDMLKSSSR